MSALSFSQPATFPYQPPNLSPAPSLCNPFCLKFIQGNIQVCQRCKNALRTVNGIILPPSFNLTIARAERRSFRDSSGQIVTPTKETMCHYHCSLPCIQMMMPNFHPDALYISHEIIERLDAVHIRRHLMYAFGIDMSLRT